MQSFLMFLSQLRAGKAVEEFDNALSELVQTIRDSGSSGRLTLALEIKPMTNDDTTMAIFDKMKIDPPKKKTGQTIMYALDDGGLSRRDPRQPDLFKPAVVNNQVVNGQTGEIITVKSNHSY